MKQLENNSTVRICGWRAELPAALTDVLISAERAVVSRPMRTRIADAAATLQAALPPGDDGATGAALRAIADGTR